MLKKIIPVLFRCIKTVIVPIYVWLPGTTNAYAILLDKVIATVNQEQILHSDLEEVCKQRALAGKVVDESAKMDILKELVLSKVFLAKAKLHKVEMPKVAMHRECDVRIAGLIQQFGSEAALIEKFQQPISHIRKSLKNTVKAEYLALWAYQYLTQDVVVTPAEVKAYFNALPPKHRPYYPASVEVYQLVIYPKIGVERQEAAKSRLLHLKQLLLDGGVSFADLAKKHSGDPYSASKGGEIGWVPSGLLAPAYEAAALALKPGEVSNPIASEFGFHLIELLGRDKNRYNTRHILHEIQPTEEEIKLAEVELDKIRAEIVAGRLTFAAAVQQYSEDKKTVAQGGLVTPNHQGGDCLPGLLVPVEALDPDVYFAIDGLEEGKVGGVSRPQYIKSHRPAWRLLYLKRKVEAHPMNLTQDYQKIHHDLLQQKKRAAVDKWIQTAKLEFVISFSPEYRAVEQLL